MICTARELLEKYPVKLYDNAKPQWWDYKMSLGDFFKIDFKKFNDFKEENAEFLVYKSTLVLNSYDKICDIVPKFQHIKCEWLKNIPLFTRNIKVLPTSDLAIEGGPCMFGTDEVKAEILLKFGKIIELDCNKDFEYILSLLKKYQDDILDINFFRLKNGITSQEFEYFEALFEMADVFQIPLIISIPDMSYMKYFNHGTSLLPESIFNIVCKKYQKVLYEISDIYINFVKDFSLSYKVPKIEILHGRNVSLCELFYEKRARFLKIKNLTKNQNKEDSIIDYISMPAMPYYLWGIKNIIEINSTDETDAIRKCIKNHKNVIDFFPIMIPEKVSRDGKTTVFKANRSLKDYVR